MTRGRYQSERFATAARVCGIPLLSGLRVVPTANEFLLMAYLYDVPPP
jgi:hypothetical protein